MRKCTIYDVYCPEHGFQHGAEAEELREKLEKLIESHPTKTPTRLLEMLLRQVDARDSVAYLEAKKRAQRADDLCSDVPANALASPRIEGPVTFAQVVARHQGNVLPIALFAFLGDTELERYRFTGADAIERAFGELAATTGCPPPDIAWRSRFDADLRTMDDYDYDGLSIPMELLKEVIARTTFGLVCEPMISSDICMELWRRAEAMFHPYSSSQEPEAHKPVDLTYVDPEIVELCMLLNRLPGIRTLCSCCGHGAGLIWVLLQSSHIRDLAPINWAIARAVGRRGSGERSDWELVVSGTSVGHDPVYELRGPVLGRSTVAGLERLVADLRRIVQQGVESILDEQRRHEGSVCLRMLGLDKDGRWTSGEPTYEVVRGQDAERIDRQ